MTRAAPRRSAEGQTSRRLRVLAALTVAGFLVPNTMLVLHIASNGASVDGYFGAWVDSLPGAQLFADLVVCSVVFLGWAAVDGRRLGVRWGVAVPATFLVGLCFSLPLYLYLRERALATGTTRRAARA